MDNKYNFTLPGVFSLWNAQGFRQRILHIFTRNTDVLQLPWEIREQGLPNITRTVAGFRRLLRLK